MKLQSEIVNELSKLIEATVKVHSSTTKKANYISLTIAHYLIDNDLKIVEVNRNSPK